ncbi:MAG: hypothetical protein IKN89_07435, partial [Oscillospiraceae bacterium]|nr:hypothetical protein [Oscillospiraceae bacterium]
MKTKAWKALALLLSLSLLVLLPAGCGKTQPSVPTPAPTAEPAASPEPAQTTPPAEEEEIVYVPSFEALPPSLDPTRDFRPVEREDGTWFIRLAEASGGYRYFVIMHLEKDGVSPDTVLEFGQN